MKAGIFKVVLGGDVHPFAVATPDGNFMLQRGTRVRLDEWVAARYEPEDQFAHVLDLEVLCESAAAALEFFETGDDEISNALADDLRRGLGRS